MKQPDTTRFDRRQFLRRAAAASAAVAVPRVIPSSALGMGEEVSASNRIGMGFIGIGMMGRGHLRNLLQSSDAQVVALCDVDRWRREDAKTAAEQAYAAKQPGGTYRSPRAYSDLRELLARNDVDAVVIATGDNWHAPATVMAAKAGKDIYCEKPISKTIHEARAMVDAVRRYDRVAQIGLQQRSTPEFIKASRLVRSGRIGEVKFVYVAFPGTNSYVNLPVEPVPEGLDWQQWLGPAPWRPFNGRYHKYGKPPHVVPWHFSRDFGGGNLCSNTVHAFDVVQWALGMDESGPVEIIPPESGEYPCLTYKYSSGALCQVVDWHLNPQQHFVPKGWDVKTRLQNFGALYVGDKGWIHVGRQGYLEAYPRKILEESSADTDPWHPVGNHHQSWLRAIRGRQRPACDVAVGCRSTIAAHLGCIAHWTGRALRWDPAKEEFVGDEEANRLRARPMRPPWRI